MVPRPDFSDEKGDSSSNSSGISESSTSSDDGSPASSELQQRFAAAVDIIDNLYKLSRSIRTPALQLRGGDGSGDVVEVRLRDEDKLLNKRISSSITQRRQQFMYRR
jgi:hypothetical protein